MRVLKKTNPLVRSTRILARGVGVILESKANGGGACRQPSVAASLAVEQPAHGLRGETDCKVANCALADSSSAVSSSSRCCALIS